jgi:hypothetical protein
LVRDTFAQGRSSGAFWLMLAITGGCVLLCLTATVDGGSLGLAFGAIESPVHDDLPQAVRGIEVHLVGWVADAVGLLLALLWTAGLLPGFLEPAQAPILLAKPTPRWALLAGKVGGVVAFIAVQDALFLGGTWLALGLRTGVWDTTYLLCLPLLLLHFVVFFRFSALLAVATRSTVACLFGSVLFWMLCWGMNLGRHAALLMPGAEAMSPFFLHTVEAGYWLLPKPLDFHVVLLGTLNTDHFFGRIVNTQALAARGAWAPMMSVVASALWAVVLLAMAVYDFLTADY